ncbi:MAG: Gfo/Idh/MocA family oxidoreductase [Armatimonadetes bacterium]|nr:Gfo/Idh/MocA family oxidoreductase [Armatimonadota bacterium]
MTRREALQTSGTALAGLALSQVAGLAQDPPAKPPRVALIGCGWYGKVDLFRLLQVTPAEVVSLCDVDQRMLADAADQVAARQASKKRPRTYGDYRKLLAEKDLDLVLIGTPDHWHALQMIEAVKSGADVYVQKPIGVDVVECEAMLAAARAAKRVVQVGLQRRSTPHLIEARNDVVKAGRLGTVSLVEIYSYYHMRARGNPPAQTPPDYLDWEMWTGPAPMRPYTSMVHPRGWRAFMEYGNGIVGDMAVHMFDMVRWMLDLGWPRRISSTAGTYQSDGLANISDTQTVTFDYGNLQILWQHRTWGAPPDPKYAWGATLYGDRGTLRASVQSYDFAPTRDGEAVHRDVAYELDKYPEDRTERDLERHVAPALRGHMRNLLDCMGTRGRPVSDIEEGAVSSASCILANVSAQLGRTLTWDAATRRVVGDDEANRLLRRSYRAPWVHPEV